MRLTQQHLWAVLLAILSIRLMTLGLYPLMDTSEARYGEMARKMLALNNWTTPMFDDGVPFWGKPPLSFWLQAGSMWVFGVNEFGARFPAWLFHCASCLLIVTLGTANQNREQGLWAAILFSGSALGLVSAGVVLTDPFLSFAVLLASYGFWKGVTQNDRTKARWGFAGLGLGLLAKGPLVLVLFGLPSLTWIAFTGGWRALRALPWWSGIGLMLAIAAPWYLLAEQATPGFLDYFLVGEHFKRYVISEWSGDLYGSAHAQTPGTIWLYLLGALAPLSLLLPLFLFRPAAMKQSNWQLYLWCWALATPAFFTMAGNILWTYLLPALPAWCLLLANQIEQRQLQRFSLALSVSLPLLLLLTVIDGRAFDRPQNQRDLVISWQSASAQHPGQLYYLYRRHYSAEFYSAGKSRTVKSLEALPKVEDYYLAVRDRDLKRWDLPETLKCHARAHANNSTLFYCQTETEVALSAK